MLYLECGYYLRAATITFKVWQEGATIRGRRLIEEIRYFNDRVWLYLVQLLHAINQLAIEQWSGSGS